MSDLQPVPSDVLATFIGIFTDTANRYNAAIKAEGDRRVAAGQSPAGLMLMIPNIPYITAFEQGQIPPGAPDQTFLYVPYLGVPVEPPPTKPLVGPPDPEMPGYYLPGTGDGGAYPHGHRTYQDGHEYEKVVIGRHPMWPNGELARWIQVK